MAAADRPIRISTPDATVWFVPDGTVELSARNWFCDLDADHAGVLRSDQPYLHARVGATLVRPRGRGPTVLIDAGLGPVRAPRPHGDDGLVGAVTGGALPDNLAAIGVRPRDIDVICFTHLDDDHVGWLRHSDVFASIPLSVTDKEWEWIPARKRRELSARHPVHIVAPGEFRGAPVFAKAAIGHTPGHCSYQIGDPPSAFVVGDALHWHTQVTFPGTRVAVDADPDAAAEVRKGLIAEIARLGVPVVTSHLLPPVGRITAIGDTYHWEPFDGRETDAAGWHGPS